MPLVLMGRCITWVIVCPVRAWTKRMPASARDSTPFRAVNCSRRWKETPSCNSIVPGLSPVTIAGSIMSEAYDVVIVGGGIAGSALATVLARKGIAVAVLERDLAPADKVRAAYMAPWGVAELKRLGLLEALQAAGALFATRSLPFDA